LFVCLFVCLFLAADPVKSVLQLETQNAVSGQKVYCKLNAADRDGRVRMSGGNLLVITQRERERERERERKKEKEIEKEK
jgi:hypothetical protein